MFILLQFLLCKFQKSEKIIEPITELRSAECAPFGPQCFGSSVLALVAALNCFLKFVSHRVGVVRSRVSSPFLHGLKIKKPAQGWFLLFCGEKDLALRPAPGSLDPRTCSALPGFKSFSSVHINKKSWHKASSFCLRRRGLEPPWNYFH